MTTTARNEIYTGVYSDKITRQQIVALRTEAGQAGDYAMADTCGTALAGDEDSIRRCERAIGDAAAQATHECVYCNADVADDQDASAPAHDDDAAWAALAEEHAADCEWIATRAHRIAA